MSVAVGANAPRTNSPLPSGHYGIGGLIASEWTKLRTVRSTIWTLGVVVVLGIGLSALATAETTAHWSSMNFGDRLSFDATQTSLIGVAFGQLVIGILGVLVMSAEYGTGTSRATLSAAPRRPMVLGAKVAVFAAVAFVVSEAVAFLSYLLGQALLRSPVPHTTLSDPQAFRAVFGAGLYLTVLGVFALGLATIIRHTAGAISAFVGALLVLPLINAAMPTFIREHVREYLPAMIGNSITSLHPGPNLFSPWTGLLVLTGYTAATLLIGAYLLVRRDA